MPVTSLKLVQHLPISLEQTWEFFSNPAKLHLITDDSMGFTVLTKLQTDKMYAGQIIEYTVKPLLGIPLYWMTEIMHVEELKYFVDEQRFGPFAMWHHQHHFKEVDGGVEMTDIVHYKNPLWILGTVANALVVRKKVRGIFQYRFDKVRTLFGAWPGEDKPDIQMR